MTAIETGRAVWPDRQTVRTGRAEWSQVEFEWAWSFTVAAERRQPELAAVALTDSEGELEAASTQDERTGTLEFYLAGQRRFVHREAGREPSGLVIDSAWAADSLPIVSTG